MRRLLLLLLLPFSLFAQTTGQVTGIALDSLGNTVSGATITVCALNSPGIPCSPVTASTSSNGQGAFSVTVPVGTYTVTIFRSGIVATSSTVVVAPSNITVPNNIVGGTASFTTLIAPKLNGRHIIDGTTYTANQIGLQQACNDAATIPNGGGICEIPPGTNITITSTLNIGSTAANQSARLDIEPGATLTVNIASASITNTVLNGSNVATYTAANTFAVGNTVSIYGTTNGGGVFNVKGATITTASPTQFTVAIVHAAVTSAGEAGCTNQVTGSCAFIDGIHLGNYSYLFCTPGARNLSLGTSNIQGLSQSLTTVRTMVSADQQNGNLEAMFIQGCQIRFFTQTRGGIDMSATFANSYARDNIVSNYTSAFGAPGILVSSGTGATGTIGPIEILNNWVLPGTTSSPGIIINAVDPEGLGAANIDAVRLWDNKLESVAGQTVSLLTTNGSASNFVTNLNMVGNWFLPSTVTANGYKIADIISCLQCNFFGTKYAPLQSTANPIYGAYLESTIASGVTDFHQYSPSLSGFTPGNFNSTFDNTASPAIPMPATADYIQQSSAGGGRSWRIADATGEGVEVSNAPSWFGGNMGLNLWNHAGLGNVGQTTGFQLAWGIPAANRNLQINDPGGNDAFTFNAAAVTLTNKTLTSPVINGSTGAGTLRASLEIADQGSICTNGELALSAGWQSTGSATVTAVAGNGQTCSWTITTGTTTAANPTVTDTLTNALPAATTVCEMNIHGGTHTAAAGEGFQQTALSATAPVFTFNGTPTAGGTTYFVTRRCGP